MGEKSSPLEFLNQYQSTNTVNSYRLVYRKFFETVYGTDGSLEDLAAKYLGEERSREEDIQAFLVSLKERAPKTVKLYLSAVRVFLIENDVEIPQVFWRRLRGRIKGSRALTLDKVPSNVELRKIMTHLPVQGKALFLMLTSSGMRIEEAMQLQLSDLEYSMDPAKVSIRGEYTKTGNSRITFISREAKEAVEEWLKIREDYLKTATARTRYDRDREDERLFPFTSTNARVMWRLALQKSGNGKRDPRTGFSEIHPHVLRKFFRSQMATVIPVDVAEALMGHEGYLTEVYRRYSFEQLAKFYKQGEHVLLVFTEAGEVGELRKELKEERDNLQGIVNGLTAENLELKARVSRMEIEAIETRKKQEAIREEVSALRKDLEKLIE